jgi:hypothetical protein
MISTLADPARSQAVRWTATLVVDAIDKVRNNEPLDEHDIESIRTFADDLIDMVEWSAWVRSESPLANLASNGSVSDELIIEAADFTAAEVKELADVAEQLRRLCEPEIGTFTADIEAIERTCSLVIRRLEPRARFVDRSWKDAPSDLSA